MRRHILAVLLIGVLSGNCYGQAQPSKHASPNEQVRGIPANSSVEVKFVVGATRRGWISDVSDSGFVLSQEVNHQMTKSPITFVQVKSVKQVANATPVHTTRNILIGVGIAVVGLMALLGWVGSHT